MPRCFQPMKLSSMASPIGQCFASAAVFLFWIVLIVSMGIATAIVRTLNARKRRMIVDNAKVSVDKVKELLEDERQAIEKIAQADLPEDHREQLRQMIEANTVRGEQLLKTMETRVQAMESGQPTRHQQVPLGPILGFLTMIVAWLLEMAVLVGQWVSGGQWPGSLKMEIATGVFVMATVYHLTLRKKHQKYDLALRNATLTGRQAITIFVWMWILGGFLGWMAFS